MTYLSRFAMKGKERQQEDILMQKLASCDYIQDISPGKCRKIKVNRMRSWNFLCLLCCRYRCCFRLLFCGIGGFYEEKNMLCISFLYPLCMLIYLSFIHKLLQSFMILKTIRKYLQIYHTWQILYSFLNSSLYRLWL